MNLRTALACSFAFSLVSCTGDKPSEASASDGGTLVIATSVEPDQLFPLLPGSVQARAATELIYDYLAELDTTMNVIGDSNFRPQLARSWTWSPDSLSIRFQLDPRARWHDGAPVRSNDVRFTYSLNVGPALGSPMGETLHNIDSVTTPDSLTAVFWFHARAPSQFYSAAGEMLIVPKHIFGKISGPQASAAAAQINPVGSGRFRFGSRSAGAGLELVADSSNYRGRPRLDRVIWSVVADYQTALTKLVGGEADVFDALHAENVQVVQRNPVLRTITLPGMDYAFLQFNLKRSPFGNPALRRALTMELDRAAMVKNVFDTLAAVSIGPTNRILPTTSPSLRQIPFDTAAAGRILDSLGWQRRHPDGTRVRDGKPLSFRLLVPSSSSARQRFAVLLQSQLKRAGISAEIEKVDFNAFQARLTARDFDAALNAWHSTPDPAGVTETWTAAASRRSGGRNYGSYENPAVDLLVDSALAARDPAQEQQLFKRVYQTIIDDAPAVWLYEPKTVIGIHKRMHPTGMRPDAWWAGIGEWWIPQSEKIARDRLPAGR